MTTIKVVGPDGIGLDSHGLQRTQRLDMPTTARRDD